MFKKGSVIQKTHIEYEYIFEFEDENGNIETASILLPNKLSAEEINMKHEELLEARNNIEKEE